MTTHSRRVPFRVRRSSAAGAAGDDSTRRQSEAIAVLRLYHNAFAILLLNVLLG